MDSLRPFVDHWAWGILVLVLIGAAVKPHLTGMLLVLGGGLYIVVVLKEVVVWWYHRNAVSDADEQTIRNHLSILLTMEHHRLVSDLYNVTLGQHSSEGSNRIVYVYLSVASGVVLLGGFLVSGTAAFTGPPRQNVLVGFAIVVGGSIVLAVGHIAYFSIKRGRTDPDRISLIAENLETMYGE